MLQDELEFAQKEVFCKRPRIKWNTRQDWSGFLHVYVVVQFYPWFKFDFPLFWVMVMYDSEFKTMGNKN